MIGPNPRYVDDGDYVGGFSRSDIVGPARRAGQQPPRLVGADGAGDHGQPRPAGAVRGADQQLLPHRPRHRPAVRARHVPLRQPRRPARRRRPHPGAAVQPGRHRARRGRGVRAPADPRQRAHPAGRHRARAAPERAGGDDRRDQGLPRRGDRHGPQGRAGTRAGPAGELGRLLEEDPADLYENAPMGYLSTLPDGTDRQGQPHVLRVDRARARRADRHPASRTC